MSVYTAVVLHPQYQSHIRDYFRPIYDRYMAPVGFSSRNEIGDLLAHHMTMNLGGCEDKSLLGREVEIWCDAWAIDERCMAVRVSSKKLVEDGRDVPCSNPVPHVTVYVNPRNGGKPRHSNNLTNWLALSFGLKLYGTILECR